MELRWVQTQFGLWLSSLWNGMGDAPLLLQFPDNRIYVIYLEHAKKTPELGSIFFAFNASDLGWRKDLHEVKDQRLLGPEKFMEEIRGRKQEGVSRVYKISLEDVIEAIEGQFKVQRSSCGNLAEKSNSQ